MNWIAISYRALGPNSLGHPQSKSQIRIVLLYRLRPMWSPINTCEVCPNRATITVACCMPRARGWPTHPPLRRSLTWYANRYATCCQGTHELLITWMVSSVPIAHYSMYSMSLVLVACYLPLTRLAPRSHLTCLAFLPFPWPNLSKLAFVVSDTE